ncbi:hypothetical protein PoB_001276800 [Plakobranchus ocellatus]|uniref:Uncharacterized protein n=1 Tax=Plakobranchus ocellatus TaxID=259542 RepID=A0AAV3YV73_9GAST|nr:hypothetical protein PoB_001276800 [Plakobranchus ocellatus]
MYTTTGESGGSSGRAVGYQVRDPGFESQSGTNQLLIAPSCPPSTKWVARPLKTRRKVDSQATVAPTPPQAQEEK